MVENYITRVTDEERLILENYVAGINKVAENLHVYPLEFYIFWHNFEPFTIEDSVAISFLTNQFVAGDWFYEMVRERLLEVYPKDKVDRIFPFQKEHMYPFKHQEMVSDKDLEKIGLSVEDSSLYDIPEEYLYKAYITQQDTIKLTDSTSRPNSDRNYFDASNSQGSNCWAIHGNLTERGKPLVACDPHLQKTMQTTWYLTRLRWNTTDAATGEVYRASLVAATVIGTTMITHGRSEFMAWGVTAINPDVIDLYVEYIRDDHYLSTNKTWEPLKYRYETIKVRGGEDVEIELKFTRNGVVIPMDLIDGQAHDLVPWISADTFKNPLIDGKQTVYALANVWDPFISRKLNYTKPDLQSGTVLMQITQQRNLTAMGIIKKMQDTHRSPFNLVFGLVESGDIGYATCGKFPIRNHKVVQGAYTKLGFYD